MPKTRKPETILRHFARTVRLFQGTERALAAEFIEELRRALKASATTRRER